MCDTNTVHFLPFLFVSLIFLLVSFRHVETEKELNTLRHDLNTSLKLLATIEQQRNHEKELAAETEEKWVWRVGGAVEYTL